MTIGRHVIVQASLVVKEPACINFYVLSREICSLATPEFSLLSRSRYSCRYASSYHCTITSISVYSDPWQRPSSPSMIESTASFGRPRQTAISVQNWTMVLYDLNLIFVVGWARFSLNFGYVSVCLP